MLVDLEKLVLDALHRPAVRTMIKDLVREVVREEFPQVVSDPEELLDVAHAAKLLDMTEGALRQAASRGSIPSIRLGSRVRFRRSDLARFCRKY